MSKSIVPVNLGFKASASVDAAIRRGEGIVFKNFWEIEVYDEKKRLVQRQKFGNLITTVGLNHALSVVLDGGTQITSWFVGLKDTGTALAADTMSSHAGWAEMGGAVPLYSESARQALVLGTAAAGSIDNAASKAVFTIDAADTVYGAFISSSSTLDGTTGTLYAAGDFAAPIALSIGWTLNVATTFTAASA